MKIKGPGRHRAESVDSVSRSERIKRERREKGRQKQGKKDKRKEGKKERKKEGRGEEGGIRERRI